MGTSPRVRRFIAEWGVMSRLCHCEGVISRLDDSSVIECSSMGYELLLLCSNTLTT
jgi:hypothetical protein